MNEAGAALVPAGVVAESDIVDLSAAVMPWIVVRGCVCRCGQLRGGVTHRPLGQQTAVSAAPLAPMCPLVLKKEEGGGI